MNWFKDAFRKLETWAERQSLRYEIRVKNDYIGWLRESAQRGDIAKVMQGLGAWDKYVEVQERDHSNG